MTSQRFAQREEPAEQPLQLAIPPRRSNRVDDLERQVDRLRTCLRIAVVYGGDKSAEGAVIHRTGLASV